MVRYLRNTLMAKLGGEQTELLQISDDERARAARTGASVYRRGDRPQSANRPAHLRRSEFRQEQRFHLELGLLKLIHAQRLLPLEELLSGVAAGGGVRSAAPASAQGSAPRPIASPSRPVASSSPAAALPLSPFGPAGGSWGSGPKMESSPQPSSAASPVATMERPSATSAAAPSPAPASPFQGVTPFPAATAQATGFASTEALTEGALAKAPQPVAGAASLPGIEQIRHAVGCALVDAGTNRRRSSWARGHGPSTAPVCASRWPAWARRCWPDSHPAAEKIIRQELQRLGAPARFLVVPGEEPDKARHRQPRRWSAASRKPR